MKESRRIPLLIDALLTSESFRTLRTDYIKPETARNERNLFFSKLILILIEAGLDPDQIEEHVTFPDDFEFVSDLRPKRQELLDRLYESLDQHNGEIDSDDFASV